MSHQSLKRKIHPSASIHSYFNDLINSYNKREKCSGDFVAVCGKQLKKNKRADRKVENYGNRKE